MNIDLLMWVVMIQKVVDCVKLFDGYINLGAHCNGQVEVVEMAKKASVDVLKRAGIQIPTRMNFV